jgi:RNA polymerase-binding transcription factor DksA
MSDLADQSRRVEEQERYAQTQKSVMTLKRQGSEYCIDCGEVIPQARRDALPSAQRCAFDQTQFESGR